MSRIRKKAAFRAWLKPTQNGYLSNIKWFAKTIEGISESFFYRDTDADDIEPYRNRITKEHGKRGADTKAALAAYGKFLNRELIVLRRKWTDEELIKLSKKYKTLTEWIKKDESSYRTAKRRGISHAKATTLKDLTKRRT